MCTKVAPNVNKPYAQAHTYYYAPLHPLYNVCHVCRLWRRAMSGWRSQTEAMLGPK
jgi:hypothetical protein